MVCCRIESIPSRFRGLNDFSGSQYHGDLSNKDERHGQGILYLTSGAWYEGSWENNEMHGEHGKCCFENVYSIHGSA